MASSLPAHQVAELHRLMSEEIREVAVFFLDAQGFVTVWNRGAEEMKGYTADEAIGSHLSLLYTPEDRAHGLPECNLREAREKGFCREEAWRQRKDAGLFWARIALTALYNENRELLGFSKITVDLTEHKRLEQCVKEREETKRILRTANAGTWVWHPASDEIEVCSNFMLLMGHTAEGATMPLAQWLAFVYPDDRAMVKATFEQARTEGPSMPLAMEARMCRPDDAFRWFYVHADWYREDDSQPYALSGVQVDIQALKSAGDDLREAVAKLKEADARKDDFLAMLAHELRNPLAPIRSAAEVLRSAKLDEPRLRRTSEIIARQVGHMTSLIDDLLDVSRVTRGLVTLEKKLLDIKLIATDAVEQGHPLISSRGHHLTVALPPSPAMVRGDHKRLVQIVGNLLNNASKYTPEGGHISLQTKVTASQVVLSVVDDGIGMEPDVAARVFDLFAQAKRTPDRSSGGLGLGLALVKSLVELHGGTVACTSEGLGKGSRFTVRLPLERTFEGAAHAAQPSAQVRAQRPLRVLVVDDNADAAQMLAMLLEASGHEVMVEYGARQALARAQAEPPDVCLLDIGLPEINGNELAQRLRAQPENANAVLIAVTGYGQEDDRQKAMAAGFRHHLVKPVDPARLVALLEGMSSADPEVA